MAFVCLTAGFAQNTSPQKQAVIDGYVVEPDSITPIDFATIQLYTLPDSSFIKGVVSGADGHFSMNVAGGTYLLKFSSVGFKPCFRNFEVNNGRVQLGKVLLQASSTMLKEAEVVAQVPAVVQKGDTTTYNASAFQVAEGSALEELIRKLPGAELDEEGNLIINGQKVTKVMMDGQEFFIRDLNSAMKDIPADMIDKLQVYHRKSEQARATGIDDGKEDLVLDLKVKPDRKRGWNGNIMAGYGNDGQYQGKAQANRFKNKMNLSLKGSVDDNGVSKNKKLSVNYSQRSDKWNVGADVGFNRNDDNRWSITDEETFITDSTSQYSHWESKSDSYRNTLSANLRMEWTPDTLTTISFRPWFNYSKGGRDSGNSSWRQNSEHTLINRSNAISPNAYHNFSTGGSFYINRRLGKPGRNLSLNFDYNVYDAGNNDRNQSRTYYLLYGDSVQVRDQRIPSNENNHEISAKLTYTEPLFRNHYLQLEYNYRNKPSVYEKYAYNWLPEENRFEEFPDSTQSWCTTSTYNTHLGRVSFVANTSKYNYSLGVNMEIQQYTTRNYFQDVTLTKQGRTVINYAPNFNMSYKFSRNTTLRMNYRGYSSQPSLNDLQARTDNTDPLNIRTGNPDLSPSFNNNISLNFSQYFTSRRSNINAWSNYGNRMNQVAWVVTYDENTGVRKNYPRNVNGNWWMELGFNFYTPLGAVSDSKFSISTNSRYNFNRSVGFTRVEGNENSVKNFTRGTTWYQQVKGSFHYKKYDVDLSAGIRYYTSNNSIRHEYDRRTYDYSFRANTTVTLFWDVQVSTDVNCEIRRGYGERNDRTRTMWNAQISKSFFRQKNIVRFNLYDILHEREVIGHSVSESSIRDWSSSFSEKYFMFSLTYKFNKFGVTRKKKSRS